MEADGGIDSLRILVFDLAVSARLVQQLETDGDVADVPIHPDESDLPTIPSTWTWTSLAATGRLFSGDSASTVVKTRLASNLDGVAYVATKDVGYGREPIVYENGLRVADDDSSFKRAKPKSVLICLEGGSAGRKMGITDREICFGNKLLANETIEGVIPEYLLIVYLSSQFQAAFRSQMTGIIGGVSKKSILKLPVPLPPLGEQVRIVAAVEELMTQCDELVAGLQMRDATRSMARRAALKALRDCEEQTTMREHWARIDRHFVHLATSSDDVEDIRGTVLNLAISGRLSRIEAGDEEVSEIVSRMQSAREELVKIGSTRYVNGSDPFEPSLAVPAEWEIRPLQDVARFIDYRGRTPEKTDSGVPLITAKNIRRGVINPLPTEFVSESTYSEWMTRGLPSKGDVLFTTEAPMGNAAQVRSDERFALAQRTIVLSPYADFSGRFLELLLLSPWFSIELRKRATGMTALGIKAAKLRLIPVPIPPAEEQRRIVLAVDAVLASCDDLDRALKWRAAECIVSSRALLASVGR